MSGTANPLTSRSRRSSTNFSLQPGSIAEIKGARALAIFGDSVTTDHISPAGSIKKTSPAGKYLIENGVTAEDFNSYGSRRGNDRVMTRGTFANVRIKNLMVPGAEGGVTKLVQPEGKKVSIYDAAMKYQAAKTPLVILAGQEYGTGSSRDWAAKGTNLLGVKAVVAQSFERIHRSNLVGMGVLPLAIQGRHDRADPEARRHGDLRYRRPRREHQAAAGPDAEDHAQGRQRRKCSRPLPH